MALRNTNEKKKSGIHNLNKPNKYFHELAGSKRNQYKEVYTVWFQSVNLKDKTNPFCLKSG